MQTSLISTDSQGREFHLLELENQQLLDSHFTNLDVKREYQGMVVRLDGKLYSTQLLDSGGELKLPHAGNGNSYIWESGNKSITRILKSAGYTPEFVSKQLTPADVKQKLYTGLPSNLSRENKDKVASFRKSIHKAGGIYCIYSRVGFYIGKSRVLEDRRESHLRDLKNGTHVNRCLQSFFALGEAIGEQALFFRKMFELPKLTASYDDYVLYDDALRFVEQVATVKFSAGYRLQSRKVKVASSLVCFNQDTPFKKLIDNLVLWKRYKKRVLELGLVISNLEHIEDLIDLHLFQDHRINKRYIFGFSQSETLSLGSPLEKRDETLSKPLIRHPKEGILLTSRV